MNDIKVKSFEEVGKVLTDHSKRLDEVESVTAVAHKLWGWLKVGFPIILGAIVAGSGATSPLGKATAFVLAAVTGAGS